MESNSEELTNRSLSSLYYKYRHLIRFAIVGVINTGVDFGVFSFLKGILQVNSLISQVIGYSAGFINSFLLNKLWTFEGGKSKSQIGTKIELYRFTIVNLASLSLSLLGLRYMEIDLKINTYVAKVIVTAFVQLVNYLGYKLWVFRK